MSRSREEQKRYERAQFEAFAAASGVVPPGAARQPAEPEPDIVVDGASGSIGVELTDVTVSDAEETRRIESERVALLAQARRVYQEGGRPPVTVFVSWSTRPGLGKRVRAEQAERLAAFIAAQPLGGVWGRQIGTGFAPIRPDLPVASLHIFDARSYDDADWREGEFHRVQPLTATALQHRLREEDRKPARYRERYAARWLLLVVYAAGPSTWVAVLDEVWEAEFESPYDRVFLFDFVRRTWGELRLRGGDLPSDSQAACTRWRAGGP